MNLKLSYYTIFSNVDENVIAYSTRTGETLVFENKYYQYLLKNEFEKLPQPLVYQLIETELAVPVEENELAEIIQQNKIGISDNRTLYQVVQPSANCQLGCGYCGQKHTKHQFSADYDEVLINRLDHKLSSNKKFDKLYVAWFGGEPLMSLPNIYRLTPKFKKLAEKHNIKYGAKIVTNGLSLKPRLFWDLAKNLNVDFFEVTLDGTAEYHDKRRFVKSGADSFDLIFNNLSNIFELEDYESLDVTFNIRCNVDNRNFDGVVPLIELMNKHNFQEKISGFYVAPIHSWGNGASEMSLKHEEFADKEIEWFMTQYENGFSPWILPGRKKEVCMVVNPDAELVDAFGDIYNCTEIPYVPGYEDSGYVLSNMKEVTPSQKFEKRPFSDWNDTILAEDERFPCPTCKMLPVCGGACPKNWEEGYISCPSAKFNIKDRLALSYLIAQKGIEVFTENQEV